MKVTERNKKIKEMDMQQLQDTLEQLRRQLFSMKVNARTSHVKNNAEFKRLRGDIARVLTFMKQKDLPGATQ